MLSETYEINEWDHHDWIPDHPHNKICNEAIQIAHCSTLLCIIPVPFMISDKKYNKHKWQSHSGKNISNME